MHKLFHLTPKENIESIQKYGIWPFLKDGLNSKQDQQRYQQELGNVVWLTDNPDNIVENQSGIERAIKKELQVITINVTPYKESLRAKIVWWHNETPKVCPHEFYILGPIKSTGIIDIKSYKINSMK